MNGEAKWGGKKWRRQNGEAKYIAQYIKLIFEI